jgi:hypothetical protein
MPRHTELDSDWNALMALCQKEIELRRETSHPKLARFVAAQIEKLAADMGFGPRQIARREFRAERQGRHIVRILTEE